MVVLVFLHTQRTMTQPSDLGFNREFTGGKWVLRFLGCFEVYIFLYNFLVKGRRVRESGWYEGGNI